MYDEEVAWLNTKPEDLWLFDKLILSRKMGYVCGPAGVSVPKPAKYIVRPCVNLIGMGKGAEVSWLEGSTDSLPPGTFWCEIFTGRHLSVDYRHGIQELCVEGDRQNTEPLYKWSRWWKTRDIIECPLFLKRQPYLNCEYIDGRLIEVHLRHNPDFTKHNAEELLPVWEGESTTPPNGYRFIQDKDFYRVGFFTKDREKLQ